MSISFTGTYYEDFDALGAAACAAGAQTGTPVALPTGWTAIINNAVVTTALAAPRGFAFGVYYGQVDQGGPCDATNFPSSGNWALGIIETSTQGKDNYLTAEFINNTGSTITGLSFAFDIINLWSRYNDSESALRCGDIVVGFSTNNTTWINIASSQMFKSSDFQAGGCNRYAIAEYSQSFGYGIGPVPQVSGLNINVGEKFYVRFARSGGKVTGHNAVPPGYQNKNMGMFIDRFMINL